MHPALVALDPLFLAHVKLFIKDIHDLRTMEKSPIALYHFYNHVVKFVEVTGIIVGVETISSQVIYTLDDGTATATCCFWNEKLNVNYKPLPLGTSVRVLGKLSTYREQTQIDIQDLIIVNDPNEELNNWLTTLRMKQEYAKPYKLPQAIAKDEKKIIAQLEQEEPSLIKVATLEDDNAMMDCLEAFNQALHRYLKINYPNNQEFTVLQQARNDIELENMAMNAIQFKNGLNTRPKTAAISTLFKDSIKSLAQKKLVCPVPNKNDWYILVDEHYAEILVMNTIQDILREEIPWRGGASIDYIQIRVIKDPLYADMKPQDVYKHLNQITASLVNRGYIYPTAEKEFKVTFPQQ